MQRLAGCLATDAFPTRALSRADATSSEFNCHLNLTNLTINLVMDCDESVDKIFCVPGDRLCKADEKILGGNGTYTKQGYIYSSLAGHVLRKETADQKLVEVVSGVKRAKKTPSIGSVVTCKVNSISSLHCKCAIHCIQDHVLKQPFRGIIRKEDVRVLDKDRVQMFDCFRPGDILLARVIGVGENHAYLLSTAENELGVVVARSEADLPMVPVNWTEMVCPKTYVKENRKVAKVQF